jgi:hypothetical protein
MSIELACYGPHMRRALWITLALSASLAAGCSHVSTVRLQPENVHVGAGMRPIAAIQANVTSFYLLFIPMPGGVDLDRAVNRMLIVTAKTMGADKIINLEFDVTPDGGVWTLRRLLGYRSAEAKGIAVQIDAPVDAKRDDGPEPPAPGAAPGATATPR